MNPIRVTAVLTHPVQYLAPWFRHITACHPEIDLTVLYGAVPSAEQQGTGFGASFTWDVPVLEGYRSVVCGAPEGKRFDSDAFLAMDVPSIGGHLRETRPDVVLVPGWHAAMQLRALRECRRMGVPVLYRGDSTLFSGPRRFVRPIWAAKTRLMLGQFSGYLAVGRFAEEYLRNFGVPNPLIFRSPHAVDNDRFASAAAELREPARRAAARARHGIEPGDFAVLFAGKFQPRKRPLDVVRAVARLGPGGVLILAGGGPLADACRAEAARHGVRVVWLGFVNQSALPSAFALADCLAVPSAWESWGLIVNEAMASGLPCVASARVACVPDLVVPGQTGEVHEPGDEAGLAAALQSVRARLDEGHDFAPACRARVDTCAFDAAAAGLVAASRRVVSRARVPVSRNPGSPRVLACCGGMAMVSGIERMTFEVLRTLRQRGAAVHCIVNTWESSAIVDRADGLGASWSTGYYWYTPTRAVNPLRWAEMLWDSACTSAGLLRDALAFRPTHVLLPEFVTALRNAPALLLLRCLGVRVVMRLGNAPEPGRLYRVIWRGILDTVVSRFVSNSDFIQRELLAHGIDAAKARTIKNTAPWRPPSATAPARQPGRIVYIGQIIPPKGLDLLLEAVARLRARGFDATLDVVGNIDGWEAPEYGGFRAAIRRRAAAPDLAGVVRLLGVREDVPDLLAAASIHCCPSRPEQKEGFAVVNLEAKRAGIPSVVFSTGSLPEMITDREDGWICRDVSVEALVEGLEYFLSDPARLERAGDRARASDRVYNPERFATAWAEEFGLAASAGRTAAVSS